MFSSPPNPVSDVPPGPYVLMASLRTNASVFSAGFRGLMVPPKSCVSKGTWLNPNCVSALSMVVREVVVGFKCIPLYIYIYIHILSLYVCMCVCVCMCFFLSFFLSLFLSLFVNFFFSLIVLFKI